MPYSARVSILVEIAEKADVSVEGVVRVLTREPVSDAIKERVLAVLDDLTPEQTRAVQRFALAALHDVLEQQGDVPEWPEPAAVPDENQLALPVASTDEEPEQVPAATSDAALVQLSSVLGELAEAVRDLRRETDAERRERVDDLAVLIDLITTGWQGLDTRLGRIERQVSRLESGRREPVVGTARPRRPDGDRGPAGCGTTGRAEAFAPPAPSESSSRDRLPIVAALTLVGAGDRDAGGAPARLRRAGRLAARRGARDHTGGDDRAERDDGGTDVDADRDTAGRDDRPEAAGVDVGGAGDDVGSDHPDEAAASAPTTSPKTVSAPPATTHARRHDGRAAAGLQADAQLGVGAGQGRDLLRRRLHPAGRHVLPRLRRRSLG